MMALEAGTANGWRGHVAWIVAGSLRLKLLLLGTNFLASHPHFRFRASARERDLAFNPWKVKDPEEREKGGGGERDRWGYHSVFREERETVIRAWED